ncbi:MAG: hypothetical protein ABSA47_11105 [Verrucomicrobiota bacterium]
MAEVANHILEGADAGMEVKDFLHEFQDSGSPAMLREAPPVLAALVDKGDMLDAFLQALAEYLATKINCDPPEWTRPAKQLAEPWFASPGVAIRNYLLLSSPAPFRSRNLFIDEDSLIVV